MGRRLLLAIFTLLAGDSFAISLAEKYSYVVVLDSTAIAQGGMELSDSLFYKISRKVIFPVNKYDIPQNSPFRRELLGEILPYFDNGKYIFEAMIVRGAASPEGPYEGNIKLSQLRREALLSLIRDNVKHPFDGVTQMKEMPEDYHYLLRLMRERNDADQQRVANVVERYADDNQQRLKGELMAMDEGRLWKRLLNEYFPKMRAARVVLFFKRRRPPIETQSIGSCAFTNQEKDSLPMRPTPFYMSVPVEQQRMARREFLSVKTNLLFDFAYMPFGYNRFCPIPNIAIEYYPLHGHFTYGASFDCPWWQHYQEHKYFQVRNYQLETRYYFKSGDVESTGYGNGAAFKGWYAQAYANMAIYGLCFDAKRGWEGEGAGAGLGVGYVMPLTRRGHWRLEFGVQLGVFFTKYDPYQYESVMYPDRHDNLYYYKWDNWGNFFKRRQHKLTWIGPTRVGITLSYDLLYRRRMKKGVSFKSWEVNK